MTQAINALTPNLPSLASAVPASYAVHHSGWIPVIDHADRGPAYVREERFPRKVKATAIEAVDYASRVIHYRRIRAAAKRRKLEVLSSPHYAAWLEAAE